MKISHHFAVYLKYCKPTVCVCLYVLNNIWLSFDPQTAVHEAPQYMRFPRQENWSGLLFLQSKRNENLTVLATATHIPDRVTGPLEGAGAGSWSLRIVHQSQGKDCCWLQRDRSRGCEGGDCDERRLWHKKAAYHTREQTPLTAREKPMPPMKTLQPNREFFLKSCESLHCTLLTYIIAYINYTSIQGKKQSSSSWPKGNPFTPP